MRPPITMRAMQQGLHVSTQKPLTQSIYEARQLTRVARDRKLVSQMGIQIHSHAVHRTVVALIQAGAIGSGGDVLVLDMGEPVKIDDVARQMAGQADRPIEIVYTGLREGEKLHEVLLGTDEHPVPGPHPMITHVAAVPLDPAAVADLVPRELDVDALPESEAQLIA